MQLHIASPASTSLMSQFRVVGGAGVVDFNVEDVDIYAREGETTIRPNMFSDMYRMLGESFYPSVQTRSHFTCIGTSPFYPQQQLNFGDFNDTSSFNYGEDN